MSKDLGPILEGWDFEPDEPQVRIFPGLDGLDKLQMRIDLGVIQMELSGRPDGQRPFGSDSLLDYYEACARNVGDDETPETVEGGAFRLDPLACAALMREGVQYYHRYLALFHLQRYDLVARDTARNLRLFAFVGQHATRERDKLEFDRFRPYVTTMNTRALALQALAGNDHREALARIDAGIEGLRAFLRQYGEQDNELSCPELGFLINWRREVERNRPVGPVERLEQQLDLAVATERYEEAARIRDQLQRLRGAGIPGGSPHISA